MSHTKLKSAVSLISMRLPSKSIAWFAPSIEKVPAGLNWWTTSILRIRCIQIPCLRFRELVRRLISLGSLIISRIVCNFMRRRSSSKIKLRYHMTIATYLMTQLFEVGMSYQLTSQERPKPRSRAQTWKALLMIFLKIQTSPKRCKYLWCSSRLSITLICRIWQLFFNR